jgi:hypothetical protein
LAGQGQIELACSRSENRAFYTVLRLAFVVACLEITNRRSKSSRVVKNIAPMAGRNTKSIAKAIADAALVLASGL